MGLRLYNTATRTLEEFSPLNPPQVTMYNCGPTVYNYAHIGNLRPYVFADILRRTLELNGYKVKQVVNITDVGHLVGDGDEGEDKMTAALKREGKPLTIEAMREVGDLYTEKFKEDLSALNILPATLYPKASDHIADDIELVSLLEEKGFTYATSDGVYFDTSKFPRYADFAKLDVKGMRAGERIDVGEKKNSTDFAIWKFNDKLGYEAPFGKGFPGWHIECSAMIHKHLGHPIDIHTGGVDHIPVHHTNEIAQSESAYGTPFVGNWMHCAHMTVNGEKMSKSLGNTFTLADLRKHGIYPMAFRYWLLTASYRTQINFTQEALGGVHNAMLKLSGYIQSFMPKSGMYQSTGALPTNKHWVNFRDAMNDDLNTSRALANLWELVRDDSIESSEKLSTLLEMDKLLNIGIESMISKIPNEAVTSPELEKLLTDRKTARKHKDFTASDRLRDEIKKLGYEVKDTPEGQQLKQI